MTQPTPYKMFSKGDLNAFWALFTDNLINLLVLSGICKFVFNMPDEVVFGRIVPGAGIAILIGVLAYTYLAKKAAIRNGHEMTAMPYGISTPVMFVYLFGVIGPIYWATQDATLAWQVGIGAGFLGGIVAALGALIGPFLKKVTPRAGMLGTLAGIALVFIGTVPMAKIFEEPIIGFVSLAVILWGLIGRFSLPGNIPAGLLALILGTAVYFIMGIADGTASIDTSGIAVNFPIPYIGDVMAGVNYLFENTELLLVIIPVQIYNFIETMNNVESAEAAGDKYPVATAQVIDGFGTMIGAVFGSPFPTTAYIGHPAYKKMGARSGYILGVGIIIPLAAWLGLLAFLSSVIPVAAAAPVLVFVAVSLITNTAASVKASHVAAVVFAIFPHVSSILIVKWGSMFNAFGGYSNETLLVPGTPEFLAKMHEQGAYYQGHLLLSQGAIITGLIWGAIAAYVIDGKFKGAGYFAIAAAALSSIGVIHGATLHLPDLSQITIGYLIIAAVVLIFPMIGKPEQFDEDDVVSGN